MAIDHKDYEAIIEIIEAAYRAGFEAGEASEGYGDEYKVGLAKLIKLVESSRD